MMKNERTPPGKNKAAALNQLNKDRKKIKFEAEQLASRLSALSPQKKSK